MELATSPRRRAAWGVTLLATAFLLAACLPPPPPATSALVRAACEGRLRTVVAGQSEGSQPPVHRFEIT